MHAIGSRAFSFGFLKARFVPVARRFGGCPVVEPSAMFALTAAACPKFTAAPFTTVRRGAGPRARRNWCSAATGATQNASNHSKPNDETNDKNAAAAVASLVAKDEGIPMTKQTIRTGVLMRVPNVSPADDIITSGLKRASRVTPTKGLRDPTLKERNRSAKQLDFLTTALCKPLGEYVKGFPRLERLHPFERALLELTLKDDKYEATLRQVDNARKAMLSIGKQHAGKAAKAKGPKDAVAIREAGFEELEKYFLRNGKKPVDELKEIAKTLRRLPVAELETPTVALVGAPNVGKSSLVRVLSSGTPEVQNYPFTTRGIKMGHFFLDDKRHIVTDTPGLLWRPDEDRNKIEKLAIATLEHLPTCVVFVFDLSGLCGTSVEDQLSIRNDLKLRFAHRRPWLDVMSKSELVPTLGGVLCADLESTWSETDETLAKVTAAFLASEGALAVSAEEDVGVTELRRVIEKTLIKHRDTLETVESTNGPGYQPISSV
jgi:nucleolar GTP-binding protein|tara:strand:- start:564 stop:2033 length:1470 start_codon:yes stop_codon:yes gene_type:complete